MSNEKRTVEVDLEDVERVYRLLEKLNAFFHQPMHYPNVEAVHEFMVSEGGGAYEEIRTAYYDLVWNWLPADTQQRLTEEA